MIEFYEDKAGKYRWRIISDNGKIIGSSSQGFSSKHYAEWNAGLVFDALLAAKNARMI